MIASRQMLSGFLVIVFTVSVLHQVECKILYPSVVQCLLRDAGKIGRKIIELLCKPWLQTIKLHVPKHVVKETRKIGRKLNSRRRRPGKTSLARAPLARRKIINVLGKIPKH